MPPDFKVNLPSGKPLLYNKAWSKSTTLEDPGLAFGIVEGTEGRAPGRSALFGG
jgi:hypothetical protein